MVLRRSLVFSILIGICLGFSIPTSSSAAIKAGQVCSKIGEIKTQKEKQLKCVKIGNKKIWSVISSKVTKNDSSSIATIPQPAKSLALSDKGGFQVFLFAHERVLTETKSLYVVPSFDIKFSPNVDPKRGNAYLRFLEEAARIWSGDWKPSQKITIALVDSRDRDWIVPLWQQFGLKGVEFEDPTRFAPNGPQCNEGSAIFDSAPFFWGCLPSQNQLDFVGLEKFAPHEYTHLVQNALVFHNNSKRIHNVPTLFSEGSADFYGVTSVISGYMPDNKIESYWREYLKRGFISSEAKSILKSGSIEKIKNIIIDSFKGGYEANGHAYYTGSYATARLVAAVGHQGFVNFLRESGKSADVGASFVKVFGISFDEFASLIAPEIGMLASEYLE